jgi:hypothetical protein
MGGTNQDGATKVEAGNVYTGYIRELVQQQIDIGIRSTALTELDASICRTTL